MPSAVKKTKTNKTPPSLLTYYHVYVIRLDKSIQNTLMTFHPDHVLPDYIVALQDIWHLIPK